MTTWEREWEGSDLFGYDVIDFRIDFGNKYSHWRLYINRNIISLGDQNEHGEYIPKTN
jgi:hypothetical protein